MKNQGELMNRSELLAKARTDVQQAIDSLKAVKETYKGDFSRAAVCAGLDIGYVIRDLDLGTRRLEDLQASVDRWIEDMEAGAIG